MSSLDPHFKGRAHLEVDIGQLVDYFQRQQNAKCGLHALNHALRSGVDDRVITDADLVGGRVAKQVDEDMQA
eukprot:434948-Pleurochrysis_carterae.AAC.1